MYTSLDARAASSGRPASVWGEVVHGLKRGRELETALMRGIGTETDAPIIILSDRHSNAEMAPIPSLLLTSAVHHHLIREKTRTKVGLVVETGGKDFLRLVTRDPAASLKHLW